MNTLPLQQWVIAFRWEYNGNLRDKKISKLEAARDNLNGEIIRIGRDKQSCNLYLEDISVSAQHAEIYFNEQQQKFFIRSLKPNINLKVDGQDIVHGKELPLKENSTIVLGLQKIEITDIQIYELVSTVVNSSQNSNPVNPNPVNPNINSNPLNLNINLKNVDPDSNKSKHWWQESAIQVAIISAVVAILTALVTWYSNDQTRKTELDKTDKTLSVEKEKVNLQTYSTEKLAYVQRLTAHKAEVLAKLDKEKDKNGHQVYRRLGLISDCDKSIAIAVSYLAPNDIEETKGWFNLTKKNTKERPLFPSFYTLKGYINIYAYIEDNRYKNLYDELSQDEKLSKPWKQEKIDEYLRGKNKEVTNYRNQQWKGQDGLVERNIISPRDFDYIENPLFFDRDEKDIIDKVEFHALAFKGESSGNSYTEAKFSCDKGDLTLGTTWKKAP